MKNFIIFIVLFMLVACSNGKRVYWCGDHPCANKKEKQTYFLKSGVVELKNLKKVRDVKRSELYKITKEDSTKVEKKVKNNEKIARQVRLEKKKESKLEINDCSNAKKLHKKLMCNKGQGKVSKENKPQIKKADKNINKRSDKKIPMSDEIAKIDIYNNSFINLVEKINEKNKNKPYPDINEMPN